MNILEGIKVGTRSNMKKKAIKVRKLVNNLSVNQVDFSAMITQQ